MKYLYETHMHTCQGSACGGSTGAEQARFYKALGYQGIIVTDHFFGGNTRVDRSLPWETWVDEYCKGYEDALEEGKRIGLDVFFGLEQNFRGDEYLVYGIDKAWLKAHPGIVRWSRRELFEHIDAAGGCVVQAHPFRDRMYIPKVLLGKQFCHAAEVANSGNDALNDAQAYAYAREFGLPMTAGTDHHVAGDVDLLRPRMFGVTFDQPLRSIHDYVSAIRNHTPMGIFTGAYADRFAIKEEYVPCTTYWMDENEQPVPTGRHWLHPVK